MKLYNTLTRSIEPFSPSGDVVTMYVCGLTPYAPAHVGHAMRSVVFDVLRRYLEFRGYEVRHVENFTDIDDKMISGAAKIGISTNELADTHIKRYLGEMDALSVKRAHVYPRATEEIQEMCKIIGVLIQRDFAYNVDGDVYFRVRSAKGYGKLSRRDLDNMRVGARVEADDRKEDPMDFALWKSQKPGEPAWESPWGLGRPGWHIECSAMAMSYLGTPVDIHGGGQELVFPHHENEIVQSESYGDGVPLSRFWVHNGLVMFGEDKMSKSLGNVVTIGEALSRFSADALRLFFLSSQYRVPLSYTEQAVLAQERAIQRLRKAATDATFSVNGPSLDADDFRTRFVKEMDNDLNAPRAIAVLFDMAREINRARKQEMDVTDAQTTLAELAEIMGLTLADPAADKKSDLVHLSVLVGSVLSELRSGDQKHVAEKVERHLKDEGITLLAAADGSVTATEEDANDTISSLVVVLIEVRSELRSAHEYELADSIRRRLASVGFLLEDARHGTDWRRGSG